MNDIFICYSIENENIGEELKLLLEKNNFNCWFKKRDYQKDENVMQITEAIKTSKAMLLIYSKEAKKANYVTTEIDIAFSCNIPILIYNIDNSTIEGKIEFYLKDKPTIISNNTNKEYEKVIEEIKNIIGTKNETYTQNCVYLCYDDKDFEIAQTVCNIIEKNNIPCYYKKRDLKGKDKIDKVLENIERTKVVILIYSENTPKSNYVQTEIKYAITENKPIFLFNSDNTSTDNLVENKNILQFKNKPEHQLEKIINKTAQLMGNSVKPNIDKNRLKNTLDKQKKKYTLSKDYKRDYGLNKKSIGLILLVTIITILIGYFLIGYGSVLTTISDNPSEGIIMDEEFNIPDGFTENKEDSNLYVSFGATTDVKSYENEDTGEFILINIISNDQGELITSDYKNKTIKNINGLYKEETDEQFPEFMYYQNHKIISIEASNNELIEEVIP